MGSPSTITTEIIKPDGEKLEGIGSPPNFFHELDNNDGSKESKLWEWFIDFTPVWDNESYTFFTIMGGGKDCGMNFFLVSY